MKTKLIKAQKLEKILITMFSRAGLTASAASSVSKSLVETSLRGVDSHGIRLAPHYLNAIICGRVNPKPLFSFKKTASGTGILNADHALGIISGLAAIDKALALAKKNGIGAVAVKNSSHFGAAAIYTLRAAKKGFLGFAFTHTESLVVPFAGKKPVLGTNPISFSAPCYGEDPICLDMSTTNLTWNKLQMLKNQKASIPAGWAVDKFGEITTSHKLAEFLTPVGSYKGYGLALMVEILCSLLSGGKLGTQIAPMIPMNKQKRHLSHFFMAINIRAFTSVNIFSKRIKSLVQNLRLQSPAKGFDEIMVAGDPEKKNFKKRFKIGIPVSEDLLKDLEGLMTMLKMDRIIF